ncbi:hypothetical protein LR48_Vigan484s000100 [Vigna angularis]|uniref:ABC1 atypical kinase-like domain-containing protein n=1 Tax=Phaseolus angularis TaxID=3914 RepID=A0A0L9TBN5_PHAAN|nr:hypothetical protein LR48_Vigan484s000100 [Vigna angularis]
MLFKEFEDRPIAAASLGQVHRAILHNGEKVVVKVQRPGLKKLFDIDLKNLKLIAEYFQRNEAFGGPLRDWIGIYEECATDVVCINYDLTDLRFKFQGSYNMLFKEFEDRPIAAASLGQVHRAILHNGEKVVVKVQRPGLKKLFDIDLKNLKLIAEYFQRNEAFGGPLRDWIGIYEECATDLMAKLQLDGSCIRMEKGSVPDANNFFKKLSPIKSTIKKELRELSLHQGIDWVRS